MRSLLKFALKAGLMDKNPMDLIESLTVSKPEIHPMSIDEVQKMMGHASMKMILERYYSYIKNYQRDDGSAFMDNVYNPSVKEAYETPDEDEKSEFYTKFTPK